METKTSSSNPTTQKTTVFNLIILDESGSMNGIVKQTLSGCNETLNVVRSTAQANPDTIRSLVSIYAFQSNAEVPSRYIVKNAKPEEVKNVTEKDYRPWGGTPLLDAVGSTLSELKAVAATHENSTGIVTIITDGYENASRHYTWQKVASLISELKEIGWTINLIGANIDVDAMARQMSIDRENAIAFEASPTGSKNMYADFNAAVCHRMSSIACEDTSLSPEERIEERKRASKKFFHI